VTDFSRLETLADAILYEGYLLYPYHARALKNQRRWTFGCLLPGRWAAALGEPSWAQTEFLLRGGPETRLAVRCRFLHLDGEGILAASVDVPAGCLGELLRAPLLERRVGETTAALHVAAWAAGEGIYRARVRLDNETAIAETCPPTRDEALARGLLSCHALAGVEGGAFVSSIDPPPDCRVAAAGCRNVGLWPVLAGDPAAPALLLAAPIILYDYPRVARESPADTFDALEIDELLRLRLLTLTGEEKEAVKKTDARGRKLLEQANRPEAVALHGAWRAGLRPGDRVRLRPGGRADAFDLALAGREATVVSVDEDLEGRLHVGVVIDDDPGRDLGLAGWPGHRFFFSAKEVEAL
jgi:hypothetical protein